MGCDLYEVGVRDPVKGMLIRTFTPEEVKRSVGWLRSQNARGADIYIRPAQAAKHGLVLVDDIEAAGIEQLQQAGLTPALVVETSPKNCQCWIKLQSPADDTTRREVARFLARALEADPNSADARHFGRLAGFTNRKPDHITDRGNPYVLLHEASGQPAPQAPRLVADALAAASRVKAEAFRQVIGQAVGSIPQAPEGVARWYLDLYQHLRRDFGDEFDPSRADWMAAVALARKGHTYETIAWTIETCSPEIDRKAGHVEDYVTRTAGKAEIWVELEKRGARWDDVKDDLLPMAQERLQERQAAQEEPEEPEFSESEPEFSEEEQDTGHDWVMR